MTAVVEGKFQKILSGQLKYTSANLALNMFISRLQKKFASDPGCMAACLGELDEFARKYPVIAKDDFAKIEKL